MIVDVIEARYLHDYTIWVRFDDGTTGEVDLADEFDGPVFEPLRDPEYFRRFSVPESLGTISWPNGADFAPEFLYEKVKVMT
jgi:hypothetical protein